MEEDGDLRGDIGGGELGEDGCRQGNGFYSWLLYAGGTRTKKKEHRSTYEYSGRPVTFSPKE